MDVFDINPELRVLRIIWNVRIQGAPPPEKKKKETLLSSDLGKFLDKKIRVKFQGGREG